MKTFLIIIAILASQIISAKEIFKLHYLGDLKPLTIEIPSIIKNESNIIEKKITKLTVHFDPETTLGLNAELEVTLENRQLYFNAKSINKSIIVLDKLEHSSNIVNAYIKFVNSEKVLAPISNGLKELNITNNILSFYTGKLNNTEMFSLNLVVIRNKFLKKDDVIFNKLLNESDYTRESITDKIDKVSIDLNKVKVLESNKKYSISILLKSTYDFKNVINLNQLGEAEFYQSITIRP
jgi:hypothetical protein